MRTTNDQPGGITRHGNLQRESQMLFPVKLESTFPDRPRAAQIPIAVFAQILFRIPYCTVPQVVRNFTSAGQTLYLGWSDPCKHWASLMLAPAATVNQPEHVTTADLTVVWSYPNRNAAPHHLQCRASVPFPVQRSNPRADYPRPRGRLRRESQPATGDSIRPRARVPAAFRCTSATTSSVPGVAVENV